VDFKERRRVIAHAMKMMHEDITGSVFRDTNMSATEFHGVDLANAVFDDVNLSGARFFNPPGYETAPSFRCDPLTHRQL
jgi:uncharacterized protein YjbI with pentapeptide repeats